MNSPEAWLSGPIPNIPFMLQPAAHALLQLDKELKECLVDFPDDLLWQTVAGRASVGFHLQHLYGVADRLITYAQGSALSEEQFDFLKNEKTAQSNLSTERLVERFSEKIQNLLHIFSRTSENELKQKRTVGRKKLPSTVMGLYFHIAEHSQRHFGQLLVTASVLRNRQ
ncbi:DinB family protein [Cyclobacterium marinum]|uniref:Metal-dependent hydrolase n=1 Tax=Cyclobacterium marinum (strain ATCC 25205 / DSM 745 / LMG 13164 / NCIMB 1802) TaxID=880070 RepID=G0IW17_CYCMS|nr:DinB family protein [Cyclobacterium marinum]AEL25562.1 metal-dependent hydrolase [Cyclobacterium marinum DSM 745]